MKTIKHIRIHATRTRLAEPHDIYSAKVTSPGIVATVAQGILTGEDQEVFLVFFLTAGNKISGYTEAHRGSLDSCLVDPRDVFRAAVVQGCSSIIVAHNHPSGNPEPSDEDVQLTLRLKRGAETLGIALLDHVVVTDDGHISLAERGVL